MLLPPFIYKKTGDQIIQGVLIDAFVNVRDKYEIKRLRVYADRTIAGDYLHYNMPLEKLYEHVNKFMPKVKKEHLKGSIGSWSDENINAIPFEDFKNLVKKRYVTQGYKGTVYFESDLIGYYSIYVDRKIKDTEFLKSLEDIFLDLNHKPTSMRLFLNSLCEFLQVPKELKEFYRKILHKAYLNVPEHQQIDVYPLSIDLEGKTPVQDIIFKRESRLDNYDDFVKVYGDDYFESRYKKSH